jgi:hypothetical protein
MNQQLLVMPQPVQPYSSHILKAFTMYQSCCIEQAMISHYQPKCNGTQDVSLKFLNYYPNMKVSAYYGNEVKVFEYTGNLIDPMVDKPLYVFSSLHTASRMTGVIPEICVRSNMNTLLACHSPKLGLDVSFWRDDMVSRVGQPARLPNTSSPMTFIDLNIIPVGYYHAYNVLDLELHAQYEGKQAMLKEFEHEGDGSALLARIRHWQNTDHSVSLVSKLTGTVLSLYFCVNPITISSKTARTHTRQVILTDINTNVSTRYDMVADANVAMGLPRHKNLATYIKRGWIVNGQ